MGRLTRIAALTAATAAAGTVTYRAIEGRRVRSRRLPAGARHAITVFRPLHEITGSLPAPLADLGDAVEVEMRTAPGERGTEIFARAVDGRTGPGAIRAALRESRSLLETGEVLRPGGPTTAPTPLNRPLRAATRHAREEGLL
jgi:hypothetical protein